MQPFVMPITPPKTNSKTTLILQEPSIPDILAQTIADLATHFFEWLCSLPDLFYDLGNICQSNPQIADDPTITSLNPAHFKDDETFAQELQELTGVKSKVPGP